MLPGEGGGKPVMKWVEKSEKTCYNGYQCRKSLGYL